MPIEREIIPSNFVGDFKVGDNLVYNANLLCELVEANQRAFFNKPIVLQVGAILEAALSQIIFRAQNYNREGVQNIEEGDRRKIEGKKIDKFNTIIDVMRKYELLDGLGKEIYDHLHTLRRYRNKIHIQDDIMDASRDESEVFNIEICSWALALNRSVLKHLSEKFPRPGHINHVQPLEVPRC